MDRKKRSAVALVALMMMILAVGCKKPAPPVEPPPPPPPPPAAPAATLTANPTTIDRGQSATLTWESSNATNLDLQPGIGTVDAQGSRQVSPSESTTYTLTASGAGGKETATARITVVIPPPPVEAPKISDEDLFGQNIQHAYFDLDRYNIRSDAADALSSDADFLRNRSSIVFTVEGHCDARGSEEYNLGLGDRRANSAKEHLINLGISEDRIRTISYGKSRPSCSESNEDCWQQNRRAHLRYGH